MSIRFFWVIVAIGSSSIANAKAPGSSAIPDTEFKVSSARSQDFFQIDDGPVLSAFVPVTELATAPIVFGAVGGSGLDLAWSQRKSPTWIAVLPASIRPSRNQSGGFGYIGSTSIEPTITRLAIDFQRWSMAREAFGMAEAFRNDRNWGEAERWYAGVCKLYPLSPYAALAAQRKEVVAMLRLLNEAGEEQSEEPPLAGPEKLKVMPREVNR